MTGVRPLRGWTAANRIALGAFAASAVVLVMAAAEARRLDPLPPVPAATVATPLPEAPAAPARAGEVVLAAVARDPFRPERTRAAGRYRLPGEAIRLPAYAPAPVLPAAPAVRLLGTVATDDGGLAALAAPTGESRVVRVGQTFAGYRLGRVGPGTATLLGPDTTLVLRLESTGETP